MKDTFSLFIEDLTILDCAIWHPLRGAIGYSWNVGIEFIGKTTDEGVVFDFSLAKKFAKKIIDSTADHGFICPAKYTSGNNSQYSFDYSETFSYTAPKQAFMVLDIVNKESIISALQSKILDECLKEKDCGTLEEVRLSFTEENDSNSSYFNYIHGLKKHFSNCQRLLHGHRSTIKVWINEERSPIHEKYLASLYHDKHLAIQENIVEHTNDKMVIEYDGNQGHFHGVFDPKKVLIMPYETTIENISKFSAETLKNDFPELRKSVVTVAAYEGIGKGSKYTLDQSYRTQKLEQVLTEGLM
jgi:6-pyruvoyl-tetrahydropterin synthase